MSTGDEPSSASGVTALQNPPQPQHRREDPPLLAEPDLDFIRTLSAYAGTSYKRCIQCGTCSETCSLSTPEAPIPRPQMAWAIWGLRERLIAEPHVWLCHECNDCSERCPRGSRPGAILAAIRRESVLEHSAPRFLARWMNDPVYLPLLLAVPAVIFAAVLSFKDGLEAALGITRNTSERIVFSYTPELPHWVLNSVFGLCCALSLVGAVVGVRRFWRALEARTVPPGAGVRRGGLWASIATVLRQAFSHERFGECTRAKGRSISHLLVFYGFLGLTLVTLWVITSRVNPLIRDGFVYPFGFWSPWKMLANLAGAAVLVGTVWMGVDRLLDNERTGVGSYFDWSLLGAVFLVVLSGFATEVLHYIRLEPHRHVVYFAHLVLVFYLLVYLPYSKLAHLLYRTTAMVHEEYQRRNLTTRGPSGGGNL